VELVKIAVDERGVAWVAINRPDRLNAIDKHTVEALKAAFTQVGEDPKVRCVILTGEGRAFSAGGDVGQMERTRNMGRDNPSEYMRGEWSEHGRMLNLLNIDKPVIAAVNGHAVGLGFDLILGCDFRIAVRTAKVGQVFANVALAPLYGLALLPGLVRDSVAKRLLFFGEIFTAEEAAKEGLIDEVVEPGELAGAVETLVQRVLLVPPQVISVVKKELQRPLLQRMDAVIHSLTYAEYWLKMHHDHKEGYEAFQQKRKPLFHGS